MNATQLTLALAVLGVLIVGAFTLAWIRDSRRAREQAADPDRASGTDRDVR